MRRTATRIGAPPAPSRRKARKAPLQARSRATVDVILEAAARVLAERGYAGTNTNLIAAVAGVSVGSIYQYFPNKDAIVVALRDRHSEAMHALFRTAIQTEPNGPLSGGVTALVRALMAAHRAEAALHAVLEGEFPFHDKTPVDTAGDREILRLLRDWLKRHRSETTVRNLDLAAHVVIETTVSLVHGAIVDPPAGARPAEIEAEIVALVMGYLTLPRGPTLRAASGGAHRTH
jgi:AcrR family transcriptional regulator